MPTVFLAHTPDMLANYYGERALAALRALGEARLNTTGMVLDARALAQAARGCDIIVSDRQTPGPAEFFANAPDLAAFLRVAVDIRNIDVAAASCHQGRVPQARMGRQLKGATLGIIGYGVIADIWRTCWPNRISSTVSQSPTKRPRT